MKARRLSWALALLVTFGVAPIALGDHAKPRLDLTTFHVSHQAALRTARSFDDVPVVARLQRAIDDVPDRVAAMKAWNRNHRSPYQNGFWRGFSRPIQVDIARFPRRAAATITPGVIERRSDGAHLWHGRVTIASAKGIRVHLTGVDFPVGARLWLRGANDEIGPIDLAAITWDGEVWCPTVAADSVEVIVEIPPLADDANFTIDGAMEIADPVQTSTNPSISLQPPSYTTCQVNAECVTPSQFDAIDLVHSAIAKIEFVDAHANYICSGGLLADQDSSSTIPYFLTANHCISTQASASSVTAYWDYRWSDCAKDSINYGTASYGSTLLATSAADATSGPGSDVTLLQMTAPLPSGRGYLGWDSTDAAITGASEFYRVSHPDGDPQSYTTYTRDTRAFACSGIPLSKFLYTTTTSGSTYGGSSGSPILISGGVVVGQLYGSCGIQDADACSYSDFDDVDGKFEQSYPLLQPWLAPSGCSAVVITTEPASPTVEYGSSKTLSVAATGSTPMTYQWYEGSSGETTSPIASATSASYTTPPLTRDASYWVRVSNGCSHDDSATAVVTVQCTDPVVTTRFPTVSILQGTSTTLKVVATGTAPLSIQWYAGGTPITGANQTSYTTPVLQTATTYTVVATGPCGTSGSVAIHVAFHPRRVHGVRRP